MFKLDKLIKHKDERGWLVEALREDFACKPVAQVYISTTKPGMIRGGHYHKRKTEWFLVLRGKAVVKLIDVTNLEKRRQLKLSGKNLTLLEVPPYTYHDVQNTGRTTMLLLIGASEVFDASDSDTYTFN